MSVNPNEVSAFVNFMKNHRIPKDQNKPITHTLMGVLHPTLYPYMGKFSIEGNDYDTFMKLYKNAIDKMPMHIVERPKKIGPIIIDIDFKTSTKYKERQYFDEHIEYLIEKYTRMFKKYLKVNDNDVTAYVFEKPTPTFDEKKQEYKDGFHIVYPEIPLDVKKRYFFFHKVKQEIIQDNGFGNIPYTNTLDDILDDSVIMNNGILMYGSSKEGREPYAMTKVYDHNIEPISTDTYKNNDDDENDDYNNNDEFIDLFSIRRYCQENDTEWITENNSDNSENSSGSDNDDDEAEKIYEMYVNPTKKKQLRHMDPNEVGNDEEDYDKIKRMSDDRTLSPEKKSDIELAKLLAPILSPERATSYKEWICVCWALYNVSPTLYPTFVTFSKLAKGNFDSEGCKKAWDSAISSGSGYTISSLHWWARMDNLKKYLEIMRERTNELLMKIESGTHDDIANVVKEMYKYTYKCVNITKNMWYEFQDNRWVAIDSAYTLRIRISEELARDYFTKFTYNHTNNMQRNEDGNVALDQDRETKKLRTAFKIYEKLKTTGFIKSVVEQCSIKFYDKKFEEGLNKNPYLLGFDNGVYDLKAGCFRRGCPDDMISMTTEYSYIPYRMSDPAIVEIEEYFNKVQGENDMREYVLRLISSFLSGKMEDQKFVIWTGSGCHAKDELIRMANGSVKKIQDIGLGEYVLGGDGRKRHVSVLFTGNGLMYKIIPQNNNGTDNKSFDMKDNKSFIVNSKHRLALRSHFKPEITISHDEIYDNKTIYWVTHHEMMDKVPTSITTQFYDEDSASKFIANLESKEHYIQYGEIFPVSVDDYVFVSENIKQHYKMPKYDDISKGTDMKLDCSFEMEKLDKQDFYGIELDGDKRYVMANNFITYNSNGKSTTVDLVHNTLGQYAGILPVTVLTRKRGASGAAVPELADKRGKRFLVIQEPEHDDVVFVGQMKELTAGNDKIHARALYGDPFTYKPQFKLILICNKLPHIPATDGGTWRRLRVTPWEAEFVDKPKEKHQFKKDPELAEKMEKWAAPFAWLLLNKYYKNYIKYGLEEPPKVKKFTDAYKKDADVYLEFLLEYVVDAENKEDGEKLDFVFNLFKGWYREAYSASNPPRKEFTNYLTKQGYVVEKGFIKGIKVTIYDEQ